MVNDKDITMIYVKQEDNLVFIQYKNGIDINIDNERAKITTYTLETGEDAIIAENDDFTTIIWKSGVYTLFIEGNTDRSSIIKMAESSFFKK